MLFERYLENLIIYGENLSFFYIVCALVSFIAVWFTWNIEPNTGTRENVQSASNILDDEGEPSLSNHSTNERRALLKSIANSLSDDDMERELQIQKQQLKDIFNLMLKDEKFNSVTFEDMEEQLKLLYTE